MNSSADNVLQRLMAEHVPDVTYHHHNGIIRWISPSTQRVLGWDPRTLIGQSLAMLSHPENGPVSAALFAQLEAEGEARAELRVLRANGSWAWMDVVEVAIPQPGLDPLIVGWARDISDRKQQEQELERLRERNHQLVALSSDVVLEVDPEMRCSWISGHTIELLGWPEQELLGVNLFEQLVHPQDQSLAERYRQLLLAPNCQPRPDEHPILRLNHRDGNSVPVLVQARAFHGPNGELRGFLASLRDVSQWLDQLAEVEQRRARLAATLDSQLDVHALLEAVRNSSGTIENFLIRDVNLAACQDTGLSRDQLIGRTALEILPGHGPSGLLQRYIAVVDSGEPLLIDDFVFPHDRQEEERRYDIRAVKLGDGLSVSLRDVTDRHRMVEELKASEQRNRELARTDPLTGLLNRRGLEEDGSHLLAGADAQGEQLALLVIDLDRFKTINDSLGHSVGDQLLISVAGLIRQLCGEHLVARFGGDEFVVLVRQLESLQALVSLAEQLRTAINRVHGVGGHQLVTSPSIGISLYPQDARDLAGLIQMADTAMYSAKAKGRNTSLFFTPSMNQAVKERLALENDLRVALERGQLALAFQPLWHWQPQGMQLAGFECLLRWHHPSRGLVSPAEFVPVAEDSGLINAIGTWVLEQACAQISTWPVEGAGLRLAVNLSGVQFRQADLVGQVRQALHASGINPAQLELEITEGVLMEDAERTREVLMQLKALGVLLAIDDFGTGYSSLNYLRAFPADRIKIDRSFVEGCASDSRNGAIVKAVLSLAHALDKDTIAEGVEREADRDFLLAHGCRDFQGYLLSQPLEAAALPAFIASPAPAARE